jgi:hypothetical protein
MCNLYYADLWIMPTIGSERALTVAIENWKTVASHSEPQDGTANLATGCCQIESVVTNRLQASKTTKKSNR